MNYNFEYRIQQGRGDVKGDKTEAEGKRQPSSSSSSGLTSTTSTVTCIEEEELLVVKCRFKPCPHTSDSTTYIKIHEDHVHLRKHRYQCKLCTASYVQEQNLAAHLKLHAVKVESQKQSPTSAKSITATSRVSRPSRRKGQSIRKIYECKICDTKLSSAYHLTRHNTSFYHIQNEKLHSLLTGKSDDPAPRKKRRSSLCNQCCRVFPTKLKLKIHLETKHLQSGSQNNKPKNKISLAVISPFKEAQKILISNPVGVNVQSHSIDGKCSTKNSTTRLNENFPSAATSALKVKAMSVTVQGNETNGHGLKITTIKFNH